LIQKKMARGRKNLRRILVKSLAQILNGGILMARNAAALKKICKKSESFWRTTTQWFDKACARC
jgi:hypothetical protein